ncbi:hypothetical protein [Burkholderia sp. NLJ2]|uniref:hypothetical protein n=1 Tax=Burkholderia sp. NLJ2 TaxID=3090699 RepID=UPI003C6CBF54
MKNVATTSHPERMTRLDAASLPLLAPKNCRIGRASGSALCISAGRFAHPEARRRTTTGESGASAQQFASPAVNGLTAAIPNKSRRPANSIQMNFNSTIRRQFPPLIVKLNIIPAKSPPHKALQPDSTINYSYKNSHFDSNSISLHKITQIEQLRSLRSPSNRNRRNSTIAFAHAGKAGARSAGLTP